MTRGKHSKAKFEAGCLAEYARTFPTVCGEFASYQFPTSDYWRRLFGETPDDFLVGLKVPEDMTVATWPKHAQYGVRAGRDNEGFLDAELFKVDFADRLMPHADQVGPLIFEFGTFNKSTFPTPDAFLDRLDGFLDALPPGFRYAVEIRNPEYLSPAYFETLAAHNVAHVLNAWTRMPALDEQAQMPGVFTADFVVVRALLARGRPYEQAVGSFEPYRVVQEPNDEARAALRSIAGRSMAEGRPAFLFVNNRLEGHAPTTIEAVVGGIDVSW